jgi:Cof subfamily protein (haloacid dehalogenase superfamily)
MLTDKVLFTDLDGTLFYPRRRLTMISKENREFLKRFRNDGGRVVTVSSRNVYFAKKVMKSLGFPLDSIGCNGAFVFSDGALIKETFFEPETLKAIIKDIKERWKPPIMLMLTKNRNMVISQTDVSSMTNLSYLLYQNFMGVYKEPYVRSDRIFYEEIEKGRVYKILVMIGITKKKIARCHDITLEARARHPEAEFAWCTQCFEITPKGCTKGTGVQFYLDYNKINPDNVLVVGDSGNDISMFDMFKGRSYCLEHGPEEVQRHASATIKKFTDLERYVYPSEETR